jgi:RNA 3'-terminal phosphate cyclase (ATP)
VTEGKRLRMLEIDGSEHSGSGTIVRDAVPFCILTGQEIHLRNIRAKRDKPGLRPQHLKALEAAAILCGGKLAGGTVGSREIRFHPGKALKGGTFVWDIGTAGSTAMLALSLMPLGLFADGDSTYRMTGGLFQDFAPSLFHLKHVLLPTVRKMGVEAELRIIQPGYVPKGGGRIELQLAPLKKALKPLNLVSRGRVKSIRGIALSSHLKKREVSRRMGRECESALKEREVRPEIEILYDERESPAFETSSIQPGATLAIWAETDTGALIGADAIGEIKKSSEKVGEEAARKLYEEIAAKPTIDIHLADLLIPYIALAEGKSVFLTRIMSEHLETNVWLVEEILKIRFNIEGTNKLFKVQRIA